MIIGVTGNNGSGKDTFAAYLVERKGFEHISLSDFIREETAKRGIELARHNYHDVGNEMRRNFGSEILATKALDRMKESKNYVVTSIRNPSEIRELEKAGNFVLVAVDAPVEARFKRIIERNRKAEKEILSFEQFKKFEAKELESQLSSSQQIKECIDMARFRVDNGTGIDSFNKAVEDVFLRIEDHLKRNSNYRKWNRSKRRSFESFWRALFGK